MICFDTDEQRRDEASRRAAAEQEMDSKQALGVHTIVAGESFVRAAHNLHRKPQRVSVGTAHDTLLHNWKRFAL